MSILSFWGNPRQIVGRKRPKWKLSGLLIIQKALEQRFLIDSSSLALPLTLHSGMMRQDSGRLHYKTVAMNCISNVGLRHTYWV